MAFWPPSNKENPPLSPFLKGDDYSSLWQMVRHAHHPERVEGSLSKEGGWEGFKEAIF